MELCANEAVVNTPPPRTANTWSFVQMNMTLLPIARPLPVSVSHRLQEGAALAGVKPCTPTQKLHHRLRQNTTNISPRRHDLDCNTAPRSDNGYCSDPAKQTPTNYSPLHRSASLSSGCAAKGLYKGKRILELQDEDRRLHPDDRITAPSPSKRSKH
ncbi:hypothetical protein PHMEG_00011486 [Phytophthora megakarya]|uniref:Uncharacterized protein n=1 Tax=Phytophthora megakarya TaxID=4795 RepID=A0A225WB43_9STRA|nr:hypothetical protein PHMEG_00011486 [Phytophthora megakarya]